jgi:two-component system CheB/CheR fusion protein
MGNSKLQNGHYVVAIGASAGGLEAINEVFDNLPSNTGFSYVVIQHLSPDYKSLLAELLAKHTSMAIQEAENGMDLEPDSVYIIPNKSTITTSGNKLWLETKEKGHGPNNAIDIFFESLAKDRREKSVAVILSGTGTDGTKGLRQIKECGGTTIVQDPLTAAFDGMPNAAIASGFADLVLPPEMIPDELVSVAKPGFVGDIDWSSAENEAVLYDIIELIRVVTDIDFTQYKRPTILRRLSKRMLEKNIREPADYYQLLQQNEGEVRFVAKHFLINVTSFFRDADFYEKLRLQVIPSIFGGKKSGDSIKVWVVACSTGEEAYSLAIRIHEYMEKQKLYDVNVKIFATDIDEECLEFASRACYRAESVKGVPKDYLNKYFVEETGGYRINALIRKMVVFAQHNVFKDPPFSKIDLVSCRNMLIYMGSNMQSGVLRSLHFALNKDGFLVLGPSENIGVLKEHMKEIDKKWKIFQCTSKPRTLPDDPFITGYARAGHLRSTTTPSQRNALNNLGEIFKDTVLEELGYSVILIDKQFEIRQAFGNYKQYMELPEGDFNLNLLKMLSQDLSILVGTCVRSAIQDNKTISRKAVKVTSGKKERIVNIIVKPFLDQTVYVQAFLAVAINEVETVSKKKKLFTSGSDTDSEKLELLEKELNDTRQNLRSVIEQLESANEELQSSNEEIISSNEELQSTNEELQSLNEELHTVNAEHQLKIKELIDLNDDLNNYFRNTDIGQIFIDKTLCIRKFTPAIKQQINLIDSDVGRSIADLSHNFQDLDFIEQIKRVITSAKPVRQNVSMKNGQIFIMQLAPYIREEKTMDGVVISFVDITESTRTSNLLDSVLNNSASGIIAMQAIRNANNEIEDFLCITANKMAGIIFNMDRSEIIGNKCLHAFSWIEEASVERFSRVVLTGENDSFIFFSDPNDSWYEVMISKMMDGLVVTITDITERKTSNDLLQKSFEELSSTSAQLASSNEKLEQSNLDLMQFASIASHDLKEPLRKIQAFGDILQARISDKLTEDEKNYFNRIIRASGRMQTLIEDVLNFSKLSNSDLPYEVVDLNRIINHILDDIEISIKEKNAVITVDKLPSIEAVPGQMNQLFQNLISNALKFNEHKEPHIFITVEKKDNLPDDPHRYVIIRIRDNGIGFEEVYKEKIFGIFQRLHGQKYGGSGIGLAICKKIVENHKGYIIPHSEPNEGSYFDVVLPVRKIV